MPSMADDKPIMPPPGHDVLAHLDNLFPLLRVTSTELAEIEGRFLTAIPPDSMLEFWCISEVQAPSYLNLPQEIQRVIVRYHRFYDAERNIWKLNPLDLLTTLCLFMQATWAEKAAYLFRWYNFSKTNLLDEEEHSLLIRGVARCLRKLNLIGVLDVSDADAKHLALEARIVYDADNIPYFRPGLLLNDLVEWLHTCKYCRVMLDFTAVLFRLIDMIVTLDARSESLLQLMHQKIDGRYEELGAPPFVEMQRERETRVFVTNFSEQTATFCTFYPSLLSVNRDIQPGPIELYAKVERRFHVPHEHYTISGSIHSRQQELSDLRSAIFKTPKCLCCEKYATETSLRRLNPVYISSPSSDKRFDSLNQVFQRYELDGLLADSEYEVVLYNSTIQYQAISLKTLPLKSSQIADSEQQAEHRHHLVVLPSNLSDIPSIRPNLRYLDNHSSTASSNSTVSVVVTGSLCNAEDVIVQHLLPTLAIRQSLHSPHFWSWSDMCSLINYIRAQLQLHFRTSAWNAVHTLYGWFNQATQIIFPTASLATLSGRRRLIAVHGASPVPDSYLPLLKYLLESIYQAQQNVHEYLQRSLSRKVSRNVLRSEHGSTINDEEDDEDDDDDVTFDAQKRVTSETIALAKQRAEWKASQKATKASSSTTLNNFNFVPVFLGMLQEECDQVYRDLVSRHIGPLRFLGDTHGGSVHCGAQTTMLSCAPVKAAYYNSTTHLTLSEIVYLLQDRHFYDSFHVRGERERGQPHHYVIVIRDPRDLLSLMPEGRLTTTRQPHSSNDTIEEAAEESTAPKLFGKFELVHGEYNAQQPRQKNVSIHDQESSASAVAEAAAGVKRPVVDVSTVDSRANVAKKASLPEKVPLTTETPRHAFTAFIQVALDYLQFHILNQDPQATSTAPTITVVCSDWIGGKNIRISRPISDSILASTAAYSVGKSTEDSKVEREVSLQIVNLRACASFVHVDEDESQRDDTMEQAANGDFVDDTLYSGRRWRSGTSLVETLRRLLPTASSLNLPNATQPSSSKLNDVESIGCQLQYEADTDTRMMFFNTPNNQSSPSTPSSPHNAPLISFRGVRTNESPKKRIPPGTAAVDHGEDLERGGFVEGKDEEHVVMNKQPVSEKVSQKPGTVARKRTKKILQLPHFFHPPTVTTGIKIHTFTVVHASSDTAYVEITCTGTGRLRCHLVPLPPGLAYADSQTLLYLYPKVFGGVHDDDENENIGQKNRQRRFRRRIQSVWIDHHQWQHTLHIDDVRRRLSIESLTLGNIQCAEHCTISDGGKRKKAEDQIGRSEGSIPSFHSSVPSWAYNRFIFEGLQPSSRYAVFLTYPPEKVLQAPQQRHWSPHTAPAVKTPLAATSKAAKEGKAQQRSKVESTTASSNGAPASIDTSAVNMSWNQVATFYTLPAIDVRAPRLSFVLAPYNAQDLGLDKNLSGRRFKMAHQIILHDDVRVDYPLLHWLSTAANDPSSYSQDNNNYVHVSSLDKGLTQQPTSTANHIFENPFHNAAYHSGVASGSQLSSNSCTQTWWREEINDELRRREGGFGGASSFVPAIPASLFDIANSDVQIGGSGVFVHYHGPFCLLKVKRDDDLSLLQTAQYLMSKDCRRRCEKDQISTIVVLTTKLLVDCLRVRSASLPVDGDSHAGSVNAPKVTNPKATIPSSAAKSPMGRPPGKSTAAPSPIPASSSLMPSPPKPNTLAPISSKANVLKSSGVDVPIDVTVAKPIEKQTESPAVYYSDRALPNSKTAAATLVRALLQWQQYGGPFAESSSNDAKDSEKTNGRLPRHCRIVSAAVIPNPLVVHFSLHTLQTADAAHVRSSASVMSSSVQTESVNSPDVIDNISSRTGDIIMYVFPTDLPPLTTSSDSATDADAAGTIETVSGINSVDTSANNSMLNSTNASANVSTNDLRAISVGNTVANEVSTSEKAGAAASADLMVDITVSNKLAINTSIIEETDDATAATSITGNNTEGIDTLSPLPPRMNMSLSKGANSTNLPSPIQNAKSKENANLGRSSADMSLSITDASTGSFSANNSAANTPMNGKNSDSMAFNTTGKIHYWIFPSDPGFLAPDLSYSIVPYQYPNPRNTTGIYVDEDNSQADDKKMTSKSSDRRKETQSVSYLAAIPSQQRLWRPPLDYLTHINSRLVPMQSQQLIKVLQGKLPAFHLLDIYAPPYTKDPKMPPPIDSAVGIAPANKCLTVARQVVARADLCHLILGPIVGQVTSTSARILCELSTSLPAQSLRLRLRRLRPPPSIPRSLLQLPAVNIGNASVSAPVTVSVVDIGEREKDEVEELSALYEYTDIVVETSISAYSPFIASCTSLNASTLYDIFLPDLFPGVVLGHFRTLVATSKSNKSGSGSANNNASNSNNNSTNSMSRNNVSTLSMQQGTRLGEQSPTPTAILVPQHSLDIVFVAEGGFRQVDNVQLLAAECASLTSTHPLGLYGRESPVGPSLPVDYYEKMTHMASRGRYEGNSLMGLRHLLQQDHVASFMQSSQKWQAAQQMSTRIHSLWCHLATCLDNEESVGRGVAVVFHLAPWTALAEHTKESSSFSGPVDAEVYGKCRDDLLWLSVRELLYAQGSHILAAISDNLLHLSQQHLQTLEHLLRDCFRIVLACPEVQRVLARTGHIAMHHPRYLLPSVSAHEMEIHSNGGKPDMQVTLQEEDAGDGLSPEERQQRQRKHDRQQRKDIDAFVHRLFLRQVSNYVHSLYSDSDAQIPGRGPSTSTDTGGGEESYMDGKDSIKQWRQGPVAVILADVVTQRAVQNDYDENEDMMDQENDVGGMATGNNQLDEDDLQITQVVDDEDSVVSANDVTEDAAQQQQQPQKLLLLKPSKPKRKHAQGSPGGKGIFSANFLDKRCWQRLRALAFDSSLVHIVLAFPFPLLRLRRVHSSAPTAAATDASEKRKPPLQAEDISSDSDIDDDHSTRTSTIPHRDGHVPHLPRWAPSDADLTSFLSFWIDQWLSKASENGDHPPREARSLLLVCHAETSRGARSSDVGGENMEYSSKSKRKSTKTASSKNRGYVTVIQDMKTGCKIHQLVLAPCNLHSQGDTSNDVNPKGFSSKVTGDDSHENGDADRFVLVGRIGTSSFRYQHHLQLPRDDFVVRTDPVPLMSTSMSTKTNNSKDKGKRNKRNAQPSSSVVDNLPGAASHSIQGNLGFARLRLFLDAWQPCAQWRPGYCRASSIPKALLWTPVDSVAEANSSVVVRPNSALAKTSEAQLVLGPILGMFYAVTNPSYRPRVIQRGDERRGKMTGHEKNHRHNMGLGMGDDPSNDIDNLRKTSLDDSDAEDGVEGAEDEDVDAYSLYVPILLEIDRPSTITVELRSCFSHHHLTLTHRIDTPTAHRPFVLQIGPLRSEERYRVRFTSGIDPTSILPSLRDWIITTNHPAGRSQHRVESNLVVVNCRLPAADESLASEDVNNKTTGQTPTNQNNRSGRDISARSDNNGNNSGHKVASSVSTFLLSDLRQRTAIPFHGVTGLLLTHCVPDAHATQSLLHECVHRRPLLRSALRAYIDARTHNHEQRPAHSVDRFDFKAAESQLLEELKPLLQTMRLPIRDLLASPSLRTLLAQTPSMLIPPSDLNLYIHETPVVGNTTSTGVNAGSGGVNTSTNLNHTEEENAQRLRQEPLDSSLWRLFRLLQRHIVQEYVDALRIPVDDASVCETSVYNNQQGHHHDKAGAQSQYNTKNRDPDLANPRSDKYRGLHGVYRVLAPRNSKGDALGQYWSAEPLKSIPQHVINDKAPEPNHQLCQQTQHQLMLVQFVQFVTDEASTATGPTYDLRWLTIPQQTKVSTDTNPTENSDFDVYILRALLEAWCAFCLPAPLSCPPHTTLNRTVSVERLGAVVSTNNLTAMAVQQQLLQNTRFRCLATYLRRHHMMIDPALIRRLAQGEEDEDVHEEIVNRLQEKYYGYKSPAASDSLVAVNNAMSQQMMTKDRHATRGAPVRIVLFHDFDETTMLQCLNHLSTPPSTPPLAPSTTATPTTSTVPAPTALPAVFHVLWQHLYLWQSRRSDRSHVLVLPHSRIGSRVLKTHCPEPPSANAVAATPVPESKPSASKASKVVAPPVIPLFSIRVFCVDSVFRSNRSDRVALLAQLEAQRPKKQLTAAAARSKQAQKKREEEERQQKAAVAQQVAALAASQLPDGYLHIHCQRRCIITPVLAPSENKVPNAPDGANTTVAATGASAGEETKKGVTTSVVSEGTSLAPVNSSLADSSSSIVAGAADSQPPKFVQRDLITKVQPRYCRGDDDPSNADGSNDSDNTVKKDGGDILSQLRPDLSPQKPANPAANSTNNSSNVNAVTGSDPYSSLDYRAPHRYAHLQLPAWFLALMAPTRHAKASFVVDDVWLLLRQQPHTRRALRVLECGPQSTETLAAATATTSATATSNKRKGTRNDGQSDDEGGLDAMHEEEEDHFNALEEEAREQREVAEDLVAGDAFYKACIRRYENSRLSELSRPPDLREVDLTSRYVIAHFFEDTVRDIWRQDLSVSLRRYMLPWTDSFILGLCAHRAFQLVASDLSAVEVLQSSTLFARTMQQIGVCSLALHLAYQMAELDQYRALLDVEDPAALALQELEELEAQIRAVKRARQAEKASAKALRQQLRAWGGNKFLEQEAKNSSNRGSVNAGAVDAPPGASPGAARRPTSRAQIRLQQQQQAEADKKKAEEEAAAERDADKEENDEVLQAQIAQVIEAAQVAPQDDVESDLEELEAEVAKAEGGEEDAEDDEDGKKVGEDEDEDADGRRARDGKKKATPMLDAKEEAELQEKLAQKRQRQEQEGDEEAEFLDVDVTPELMAQLKITRGKLETESIPLIIDAVVEYALIDGVDVYADEFYRDLLLRYVVPITPEDVRMAADIHVERLIDQRALLRQTYGRRTNPFGL